MIHKTADTLTPLCVGNYCWAFRSGHPFYGHYIDIVYNSFEFVTEVQKIFFEYLNGNTQFLAPEVARDGGKTVRLLVSTFVGGRTRAGEARCS